MKRPRNSINVPKKIIFFEPNLSSYLPIKGALTPRVITKGITIKLAWDVVRARIVTANAGKNTMAVWLSPVPIDILDAIFTSRLLSKLTSITWSSALLSILTRTGKSKTAAIRNVHVYTDVTLPTKLVVLIWLTKRNNTIVDY